MKPILEHIEPQPGSAIHLYRRVDDHFAFYWHHHREYELTLIVESAGRRLVGDAADAYEPGQLVLLGPWLAHSWHSAAGHIGRHDAVVAHFTEQLIAPWPETQAIQQLLSRSHTGLSFHGPSLAELCDQFNQLPETRGLPRTLGLLDLLNHLATDPDLSTQTLSTAGRNPGPGPLDARIAAVLSRMTDNFTLPLSQAEEAERVGMTPSGFARLFRRVVGRSFTRMLQDIRITEACHLLSSTEKPITRIAFDVGFNNLSNFNRTFKNIKNLAPREYRKQHPGSRIDRPEPSSG